MSAALKILGRCTLLLFLLGVLASPVHAQEVFYLHTDALGTVVAETDASGTVVQRSEYEPYGKVLNRPVQNGPGYTGHVEDAATGLTYMQQRYYDPSIGRFLSVDAVSENGTTGGNFNRYWYANNNPYVFYDPDGRMGMRALKEVAESAAKKLAQQQLRNAGQRAVRGAWKMEQRLVSSGKPGTRAWTSTERSELIRTGKVKGYDGHHINTKNGNVDSAGDPNNIQFLTIAEHRTRHAGAGGTQTPISGQPLLDRRDGGRLPGMYDSAGYSLRQSVTSAAVGALGFVGAAANIVDHVDPISVMTHISDAGPEHECGAVCRSER